MKVEPPPAPKVEPPVAVARPTPKVEPTQAAPAAAKPVTAPELRPGTRPVARTPPADEGLPEWLWLVAAVLVLIAALIGWRLWRRREAGEPAGEWAEQQKAQAEPTAPPAPAAFAEEPMEVAFEVAPEMRRNVLPTPPSPRTWWATRASCAGATSRSASPRSQNRTIVLEDPASVVKGARLFYEDGALPRAVELLQFAIDEKPGEVRPWLALFEIFRLERLTGEFAELAKRFREHHGKGEYWRKVQYFGREIDPGNALYREEPINTLETVGPREAKRPPARRGRLPASTRSRKTGSMRRWTSRTRCSPTSCAWR